MAYNYTTRNGQRVEVSVATAFDAMAAEFRRVFGLDLIVSSGTRTRAEQAYLWDGWINRRPGFNLAAKPGFSNHEESGPIGPIALDLRDSGSDAGVTVIGSARSNWLAANAPRWGFTNAGHFFSPREGWHYEKRGSYSGGGSSWPARAKYGAAWVESIQKKANKLGAKLDVDGKDGPATQAWVKSFQSSNSLTVDGIAGPDTNAKMDKALSANAKLDVDGELGPITIRRMQKAFGVTQDGEWGPNTTRAIQKHFGVTQDGELGPITIRAYQRALGVTADGEIGPNTIRAIQSWLNQGGRLVPVPEPTEPTAPAPAATPRTPTYPEAVRGWNVPLSSDRDAGSVIDRFIIHHTTNLNSEEAFFKTKNSRSSCPTWYVESNGSVVEMIDPGKRPSATGSANTRSVAVETQNTSTAPLWGISEASHESIAQIVAWFHMNYHGKTIDGFKVDLPIDRTHVIGHNEAGVNATACPGPSMNLDEIVVRAKEIVAEAATTPKPDDDTVSVKKSWLQKLIDDLKAILTGN